MHIHAAGHQASSTCRHTTVAPMHGGSNLVCRAPATALKPVQLLSGPRFHAHKQAGTLQALPSGNTASAIVGKGPRPAIRKRAVAAAALAANNGASGGGEGEEVVGPRKSTRLCQHPACVTRASYGYPGGAAQVLQGACPSGHGGRPQQAVRAPGLQDPSVLFPARAASQVLHGACPGGHVQYQQQAQKPLL